MITQPSQLYDKAQDLLNDPRVQKPLQASVSLYFQNLGWLKAFGVLLTAAFVAATIFFVVKTGWLALRVNRIQDVFLKSNLPKKRSVKAWRSVKKHFFDGDDNSLKIAIIEADNLLDEALKIAGLRGITLGDKLKGVTEEQLPNINLIWEAHKIRNRIAHEAQFKLNRDTAEKALAVYEQTLKDLTVLD